MIRFIVKVAVASIIFHYVNSALSEADAAAAAKASEKSES